MSKFNQVLIELKAERNRAQQEMENLDEAIRVLRDLAGNAPNIANAGAPRISAAGRARIAAAQRARWAKVHRAQHSPLKRTLSVAGRNRIAAAQRARWAKQRLEQKKAA
jgi:hypothetical protein